MEESGWRFSSATTVSVDPRFRNWQQTVSNQMALSAENRLRKSTDFAHVMRGGQRSGARAGDGLLLISGVPSELPDSRIGFSVSKRVGGSVTRNRVRRRLREIFRELVVEPESTGEVDETSWDFVASVRPNAAEASYEDLRSSARRLIAKVTDAR